MGPRIAVRPVFRRTFSALFVAWCALPVACGTQASSLDAAASSSATASSASSANAPAAPSTPSTANTNANPSASAAPQDEDPSAANAAPQDDDDVNAAGPSGAPSAGAAPSANNGSFTQIIALGTWVPVRREPRRDAPLVGYLRAGGIAQVTGAAVSRERCPVRPEYPNGGWTQLAGGGYVCVGGALAIPYPVARGVSRPVQPAPDGGMPYEYAIVYGNANMYAHLPSPTELRTHETWRAQRDAGAAASAEPSSAPSARRPTSAVASAEPAESAPSSHGNDAPEGTATDGAEPAAPAPSARPSAAPRRPERNTAAREEPAPARTARGSAETREQRRRASPNCDPRHHRCLGQSTARRAPDRRVASTATVSPRTREPARNTAAREPARVENDGRPQLRDLRGERGSVVIRRLLSGMYVALDRVVTDRSTGERYWRTQSGGFVRTGPLSLVRSAPTFSGVTLDETRTLPYAFMVSLQGGTYRPNATGRGVSYHRASPRLTGFALSDDPPIVVGTSRYFRTTDGLAVLERNVRVARQRIPPAGVGPTTRWIDVDLDQQILVAYEGPRPVYCTLVSTGRRSDSNPERNYETPAGSFHIRSKHISTTMDGDTAADGPYSIEDVPWAMYFFENYALHGAFWHGNFGWRMSHGCVNLSPPDARWIFNWSEPALPEGWHGVFASTPEAGTLVELHHGDRPTPRRPQR